MADIKIRDYFAAKAMAAMILVPNFRGLGLNSLAEFAYDQAEAMVLEANKRENARPGPQATPYPSNFSPPKPPPPPEPPPARELPENERIRECDDRPRI